MRENGNGSYPYVAGSTPWAAPTASGVAAGLLWGVAFLIPEVVTAGAIEITAGRYLVYGGLSALLLTYRWRSVRQWLDAPAWIAACLFAIAGNAGYYLFVVFGIHLVGAPVTATIIGTLPITVALVGNLRARTIPFRRLAAPLTLVLFGLLLVNGVELATGAARPEAHIAARVGGILAALTALVLWTAYGVGNAEFLQRRSDINGADWSTVVGVATGAFALILVPLAALDGGIELGATHNLVIASVILGVIVSWGGTVLWNHASWALPTVVIGLLVVVETASGIGYVAAYTRDLPPVLQLLGIACVLSGVALGVRIPLSLRSG